MAWIPSTILFFGVIALNYNICVHSFHFDMTKTSNGVCFMEELEDGITVRGAYNVTFHGQNVNEQDVHKMRLEVAKEDQKRHLILNKDYSGIGTFAFLAETTGMYEMCFTRAHETKAEIVRIQLHYDQIFKNEEEQLRREREEEEQEMEKEREKEKRKNEKKGKKEGKKEKERKEGNKEKERKEGKEEKESKDEKDNEEDEDENDEEGGEGDIDLKFGTEKAVRNAIDIYTNIEEMLRRSMKREKRFRDLSKTTNSRVILWAFLQLLVLGATAFWQMRHLTKFFIFKKLA